MSEPFVFTSVSRIKDGHLEAYRAYTQKMITIFEAREPRLIAFSAYVNAAGTHAATVQVHPDVDSMLFHMQVLQEHMDIAFEHLELESVTLYGKLTDQARAIFAQMTGSAGIPVQFFPQPLAGFTRVQT